MLGKAVIGNGKGGYAIQDIIVEDPGPNEVLVSIKASGVCHTDFDSMNWAGPLILGHEGSGIVEKVGQGVQNVRVGDHVLLNWATPCGECFQCKKGAQNICVNRKQADEKRTTLKGDPVGRAFRIGTMSTHTVVHKVAVTKVSEKIPHASACIVGCGVMTGVGSVINAAKVSRGSRVVVIGTGGVGLNIIQGAKICGAAQIIAIDINPKRLQLAREFGATETIQASRGDRELLAAAEDVKRRTNGLGADYAFESTSVPSLGAAPLAMCRNGGVAIQASGIEQRISFDMSLFEWDKTYMNPLYGQCQPERDFPKILKFYKDGKLKLDEMITRTYALEDIGQAFEDMHAGVNAKGVLVIDH